ncbi:MAG: hypothetical protein HYY06_30735 [Deltaproteobacteria bacterium]|nr:hypothetical protein [Deltaproteobacteria bacterium]
MKRSGIEVALIAILSAGCSSAVGPPEPLDPLQAELDEVELAPSPGTRRHALPPPALAAAVSQLVPYSTDGRTLGAIRSLYELGRRRGSPGEDEARYLAAAASVDLAAWGEFSEDPGVLRALAELRGAGPTPAALYTALAAELRVGDVYAAAARGLGDAVQLLRLGPRTPQGIALALRMVTRRSPAAHVASLFYVDAVRRAVLGLGQRDSAGGIAALAALGDDPCARGCPGSVLAQAPEESRRAASAVQRAYRSATSALGVTDEDPFAALVRGPYEAARAALSRVALPERGGARGAPGSRVLVEVGEAETRMSLLPVVAVIAGEVDRREVDPAAFAPRTVRHAPRWGAKVVAYEPFTEAARAIKAQATAVLAGASTAEVAAAGELPVAVVVNDELEAHVFARVILSLMAAGLDDVRLRRVEGDRSWEVRLHPVAGQRVDEEQTRGRAKVEVFGPFDYDRATRTLARHAQAGRPASAQLVLFALIASRALYRALDAVRETWPDADPDIMLVLPAQVP